LIVDPYRVRARNTALDSNNAIHHDDVAREYGFRGGLVPGVDVYAYMTPAPVREWGREWLEHGAMTARFHKPVYDGEEVSVGAQSGDSSLTIELRNPAGDICATARAEPNHAIAPPDPSTYPRAPVPDPAPPASLESLAGISELGTFELTLSDDVVQTFLADVDEPEGIYVQERLGHPAHLLRTCNWILATNVKLGPWIHAQSDCHHFAAARWGERMETRGRVAKLYERKGHRFVDLDILITGEGDRPLMHVRHVAIYEPARAR